MLRFCKILLSPCRLLRRSDLLHLLVDSSFVAEGIDELSVTSTPKHVCNRNHYGCTRGDCLLYRSISIFDLEHEPHSRAPERAWAATGPPFAGAEFITHEHAVPADVELSI